MENDVPQSAEEIVDAATGLWAQIMEYLHQLTAPWQLYQLAIVAGLVVLAWAVRAMISPRFMGWVRSREGWPKWRLRLAVLIDQRLWLMLFTAFTWATYSGMRATLWPSRSHLIGVAATIAMAWLVVSFATRLIRNRFLRGIATWGAWIWVTLHVLNFWEPAANLLESAAISFGDFRLSALGVLKALLVTGLMVAGARALSRLAASRIGTNEDISPSMRVLIVKVLQIGLFTLAVIVGLKSIGFDLTGLAVFSGAVGVGLGFGLQKVVSNLVSGVIILLDKSIKPGDVISIGDTFGWIHSLGARYVSVVTRDGKEYLIPNEDLITGQVVNWSHSNEFVRVDLFFGTAYGDDPHLVRKLAVEAAQAVPRVLPATVDRHCVCHVTGFGDSSVDYVLRFWIGDAAEGLTNVRGQVYLALWDAFKANGISIPFPQREVRMLGEKTTDHGAVSTD